MKFWLVPLSFPAAFQICFDFSPQASCTFGSIFSFSVRITGFQRVDKIMLSAELPPFLFLLCRFLFSLVYGFIIVEDCTSVNTISDFSSYIILFSVLYNISDIFCSNLFKLF